MIVKRKNKMSSFRFEVAVSNNGLVVLEGYSIKYWAGEGLPTYEGSFEGFDILFPSVMQELIDSGIITKN